MFSGTKKILASAKTFHFGASLAKIYVQEKSWHEAVFFLRPQS